MDKKLLRDVIEMGIGFSILIPLIFIMEQHGIKYVPRILYWCVFTFMTLPPFLIWIVMIIELFKTK